MSLYVDIKKKMGNFLLDVHFSSDTGTTALLGPSGSGKSVTLRCIAGILTPDEGRILLNGRTLFDSGKRINLPPQKRRVGYLFQQYALFPNMSVRRNIRTAAACHRKGAGAAQKTEELLSRFHLQDVADSDPKLLSGGQQQRAALARIFASDPEAILLDEPLSALDSWLSWQLEQELSDTLAAFPGPALWVTHDRREAVRNCEKVCVMENGRTGNAIPMEELFLRPGTAFSARISGCKNIISASPMGSKALLRPWNLTLECGRPLPFAMNAVGLRVHHLHPAGPGETNAFVCRVKKVTPDVFGDLLTLIPEGSMPDAPALYLECGKGCFSPGSRMEAAIRPQDILVLTDFAS